MSREAGQPHYLLPLSCEDFYKEKARLKDTEIPGLSRGNEERRILIWREGAHGGADRE